MKTVGIVSRKGGVGKSTLAVHLADLAAQTGDKVALIDMDLQASCVSWRRKREDSGVVVTTSTAAELPDRVAACERLGAKYVFIDTRPDIGDIAQAVIDVSDVALVPTGVTVVDLESIAGTLGLVRKRGKRAHVVFNRVPARSKDLREAQGVLTRIGQTYASGHLGERLAYPRAMGLGMCAGEIDDKAKRELGRVWRWFEKEVMA